MAIKDIAKTVYARLPLKKQIFSLAKLVVTPTERLYRHLHFKGDFSVDVGSGRSFLIHHYGYEIENELFWRGLRGGWESTALTVWASLAKRSNVIFDVGANTGIYSLVAKSVNSEARVFALEPISRVYRKLVANCELNEFDINCLEIAASDRDGVAEVYHARDDENPYSSTFHKEIFADRNLVPVNVEVRRIDSIVRNFQLDSIELMKIDVEGHEAEVVTSLGTCFDHMRPVIFIEILTDEIGRKIHELLDSKDVRFLFIDETRQSLRETDLRRRDTHNYIVCPAERLSRLLETGVPIVLR